MIRAGDDTMIRAVLDTLDTRRFRSIVDVLRLAVIGGTNFYGGGPTQCARIVAKRHRRPHWVGPHQGVSEMARRRRQIASGRLTRSNGLVCPCGCVVNSHGVTA